MLMTPLLKPKVEELFFNWFSEANIQLELREELQKITLQPEGSPLPDSSPVASHGNSLVNGSLLGINARPSSPPIPPNSPTGTPRSPRRRLSTHLNRSQSKKGLRYAIHKGRRGSLYPGCAKDMKRFYFPYGVQTSDKSADDTTSNAIDAIFDNLSNNEAKLNDFSKIVKACGYPLYWRYPLFSACDGSSISPTVTRTKCKSTINNFNSTYHDQASLFYHMLLKPVNRGLVKSDFEGLLQDIINHHPGLQFLLEAPEFHSRYIATVIARIFYSVNRSWSGSINLNELRKSNFLAALARLEDEDDINQIMEYFSYEHFYVIYCKFWELDTDHDMSIDKQDLKRYCNGALSENMVDRLFDGCVTRNREKMNYADFVWFILSEVDKSTPTAIEYWFRCMDVDGDGIISIYEMEHFYEDQLRKMIELGMETLSFHDCLCQMLDVVKPTVDSKVTLRDIKACKLAPVFFDTFFNLDKWIEHEQKDPFQLSKDGVELESAWDRFVFVEYDLLIAEEGAMQDDEDDIQYEEEEEDEEEEDLESEEKYLDMDSELSAPRWSVVNAVNDNQTF